MDRRRKGQTVLAKKISLQFLLVSVLLMVVSLLISFHLILPGMMDITLNKNKYIAIAAANQLDDDLKSMLTLIDTTVNAKPFRDTIRSYELSPEDPSAAAKVNLALGNYVHNSGACRRLVIDDYLNQNRFSSIGSNYAADEAVFSSLEYQMLIAGKKSYWTSPVFYNEQNDKYTIAYASRVRIGKKTYIAAAFMDISEIVEYLLDIDGSFFDEITLYDAHGNLLFASETTNVLQAQSITTNINQYLKQLKDTSDNHYIYTFGSNNLAVFIGYTTNATLLQEFRDYFILIVVLFILIIIITDLIMLPIVRKKLLPLQDLSNAMQDISEGQTDSRIHLDTKDEISTLCEIYNNMLDTLQENTEELVAREKEQNRMKYSLLISQIDPHFMFNTMNIINSLARSNRTEEVIQVNTALIQLLQDRLRISSTEITDTIEHEISIVKEYLKIVQIRTEMEVSFLWNCPDELLSKQIPKNLLQPVIENSLKHGLYDLETGDIRGTVEISFFEDGAYLCVTIADDGVGITDEALAAFRSKESSSAERGRHIGLRNIADRLSYIYPDIEEPLTLENRQPHGTKVTLKVHMDA